MPNSRMVKTVWIVPRASSGSWWATEFCLVYMGSKWWSRTSQGCYLCVFDLVLNKNKTRLEVYEKEKPWWCCSRFWHLFNSARGLRKLTIPTKVMVSRIPRGIEPMRLSCRSNCATVRWCLAEPRCSCHLPSNPSAVDWSLPHLQTWQHRLALITRTVSGYMDGVSKLTTHVLRWSTVRETRQVAMDISCI